MVGGGTLPIVMSRPATLQDVAVKAAVNRSTVSLALRDHPRVSEALRKRIKAVAMELGYRSNPLVTALMRSRRMRRSPGDIGLAYVTNYPTRYGWRPPHHDRPDFFPGAAKRAAELGYKLEDFWLGEPGMTPKRMAQILCSRGIHGLLIGRLPPGQSELDFPWEGFACVALGLTLKTPRINHVGEDAFASAMEAMNRCRAAGYRKVGMVFSEPDDSPNTGDRYLGAYLIHQARFNAEHKIPPCDYRPMPEFAEHFFAWMDTYRPEVVLATHAEPIVRLYAEAGRMFPRHVRLVALVNDKLQNGFAGMHHDPAELGALAVDMVVGMLHRSETGLPSDPHHVLVPGRWIESRDAERGAPEVFRAVQTPAPAGAQQ